MENIIETNNARATLIVGTTEMEYLHLSGWNHRHIILYANNIICLWLERGSFRSHLRKQTVPPNGSKGTSSATYIDDEFKTIYIGDY